MDHRRLAQLTQELADQNPWLDRVPLAFVHRHLVPMALEILRSRGEIIGSDCASVLRLRQMVVEVARALELHRVSARAETGCRCGERVDLKQPVRSEEMAPLFVIGYLRGCPLAGHRPDRLLIYGVPISGTGLVLEWPGLPIDSRGWTGRRR